MAFIDIYKHGGASTLGRKSGAVVFTPVPAPPETVPVRLTCCPSPVLQLEPPMDGRRQLRKKTHPPPPTPVTVGLAQSHHASGKARTVTPCQQEGAEQSCHANGRGLDGYISYGILVMAYQLLLSSHAMPTGGGWTLTPCRRGRGETFGSAY